MYMLPNVMYVLAQKSIKVSLRNFIFRYFIMGLRTDRDFYFETGVLEDLLSFFRVQKGQGSRYNTLLSCLPSQCLLVFREYFQTSITLCSINDGKSKNIIYISTSTERGGKNEVQYMLPSLNFLNPEERGKIFRNVGFKIIL